MCDQCMTEMLSVYSETKNGQYWYIGIAREGYMNDFEPGDVMLGKVNNPHLVLDFDLYTTEEYIEYQEQLDRSIEDPDKYDEPEHEVIDRLSCATSEEDLLTDGNIFHDVHEWYRSVPEISHRFTDHFGRCDEDLFGGWWFLSHVITSVGDIFKNRGIPLDKESRLSWAHQFPQRVMRVEGYGNGTYEIEYYDPEELKGKVADWEEGEDFPLKAMLV